jgi:hypothetical protein
MNTIMMLVQGFLDRANREAVEISDEVLDEFSAACRQALKRQFTEQRKSNFTIRMSNVGRDLCQLQLEQAGTDSEVLPYNHVYKMLTGDLHEAAMIAILKSSGVNVEATQQQVSLDIAGITINGTYDIKSASSWAFTNKFAEGSFDALRKDDGFGYVAQGFGYAEADKAPFGGWIVVDKTTGEWSVSETPSGAAYDVARLAALDKITTNVTALTTGAAFARGHRDVEEFYYRKPTGNKMLGFACGYCPYKQSCWKDLKHLPQTSSKGQFPKMVWYTHVADKAE